MSAAAGAVAGAALQRRVASPWLVAVAVVIPTFMEVLDTTIANVALRYIAGGLSAPATDSEWIITSYLAANAVILPISGWLGARLGRRRYFLLSIFVFTLASALCGMAASLPMLIAARVLQGLAGGGLQPSSQGILLDAFPPAKHGLAMTMFAVAALLAPVVGPTLGGYITDNVGWRWIFYLNLPIGIFALILCRAVVHDPPHITAQRERMIRERRPFDFAGLTLLVTAIVCWEVLLSKGQEWDWFGDPFWRIQTLAGLFVGSLAALVFVELRSGNPLINFRTLLNRNYRICCILIFCAFGLLYANTTTLPGLLQSLFGYDATTSGLVLSPAGVFAVIVLIIVGRALAKGVDARLLMGVGLITIALGNLWMSRLNLAVSPWQIVWPRVVIIMGLSFIFAPLNTAAFAGIPLAMRGSAVGLLALLRNEGGSVGTSVAKTIHERREQFHSFRLTEHLDPFNQTLVAALARAGRAFSHFTGDPVMARQLALGAVRHARDTQASALAYFDVFAVSAALCVTLLIPLAFMRRATLAKGEHAAAD